ncbi:unnamed protein product [Umbelopsis ramanniana]
MSRYPTTPTPTTLRRTQTPPQRTPCNVCLTPSQKVTLGFQSLSGRRARDRPGKGTPTSRRQPQTPYILCQTSLTRPPSTSAIQKSKISNQHFLSHNCITIS